MSRGPYKRKPLADRVWEKVLFEPMSGCWLWTGATTEDGYGKINEGGESGRTLLAHRVVFELVVGPVPEGMTLDHLCRNRACVNPLLHLEPVGLDVNILRGAGPSATNARKLHCSHGHPLDGDNLYVDAHGHRICKECRREKRRRWRASALPAA